MALTAPGDAGDYAVSIERVVSADQPNAGTVTIDTIHGSIFGDNALSNVATFFGLNGRVDLGSFEDMLHEAGQLMQRQVHDWLDALRGGDHGHERVNEDQA